MLFDSFGVKGHIYFKFRVKVGVSASHYGANRAMYIAADRKCSHLQVTEGQDKHGCHWSAQCSKQMLLASLLTNYRLS